MFLEVFLIGILAGMSPGPDFFIVMKNSLAHGKKMGIATAIGVGTALMIHATYTVLGLTIVIQTYGYVFKALQLLGAGYLAYLGLGGILSLWRNKEMGLETDTRHTEEKNIFQSFKNGFFCNLLNPKAFLFFLSIFSQLFSADTAKWVEWIYAFEIVFATSLWFVFLATIISTEIFRDVYKKTHGIIDGVFGGILLYFSYRLSKSIFD